MILTVTLNPTVDKAYEVEKLVPGEVVRAQQSREAAAGKGIQVAKVARLLGEPVIAAGFLGGRVGAYIEHFLEKAGIETAFVQVEGDSRTCINIKDLSTGKTTEILEPGPDIPQEKQDAFLQQYKELLPRCEIVVLAGSVPAGIDENFYPKLITLAKQAGKTVLFDSSGKLLKAGVQACPDVIKPNKPEMAELLGRDIADMGELITAAKEIQRRGVKKVIVSLGKDGALFVTQEGVWRGTTPDIPIVNTVGCGDSMVAGFATGISRKLDIPSAIKLAMAVSTANALRKETGFFLQEDLDRLLTMVDAIQIN